MATNLAIDPELLDRALAVGGLATKKETVTTALQEFIARRQRATLTDLFGAADWSPDDDYKAERRSRDSKVGSRR
jgi:Arc/MetJ family transcription regulator